MLSQILSDKTQDCGKKYILKNIVGTEPGQEHKAVHVLHGKLVLVSML